MQHAAGQLSMHPMFGLQQRLHHALHCNFCQHWGRQLLESLQ
jgi:hypothetical protein